MVLRLFLILMMVVFSSHAQSKYLLLQRGKSKNMVRIYPGETMTMRFKNDRLYFSQKLVDIQGDKLIFEQALIPISSIGAIDVSAHKDRGSLIVQAGEKLPIAGVGYILLDQFNRSVIQGQPFEVDENVIRTGGILVAIGMIFKLSNKNTFKVNERNRIKVIDMSNLNVPAYQY